MTAQRTRSRGHARHRAGSPCSGHWSCPGCAAACRRSWPAPTGCSRTVRWVHAGEVPNIASLLKGGELLLTTGYGLGTRPAEQRAFVRTLADRGIAALVVELGPRFTRLPAALVETARAAGLPLVQLHREVPFVTVTEEIHTEIVNGHYALLQRAEEVHRAVHRGPAGRRRDPPGPRHPGRLQRQPGLPGDRRRPAAVRRRGRPARRADPLQVWEGLRGQRSRTRRRPGGPGGRAGRRPGHGLGTRPARPAARRRPARCPCTGWPPSARRASWPWS